MTPDSLDFENIVFTYAEDGPRQYWEAHASGIYWVLQRWANHEPLHWVAFAIQAGRVLSLNCREITPTGPDLVGPLYFETDPGSTAEPQRLMHGISWLVDRLPDPAELDNALLDDRPVSQTWLCSQQVDPTTERS